MAETIKMVVDLVNVFDCFNPLSFRAWLDSCKDKRKETIQTLKSLKDFFQKETLSKILEEIKDFVSDTAGFDNVARYNQGRLFFEVASSFVGVSEIKNALKGGNLALVVSETLKKAPKESLKIITSTPKITSKTAKEIIEEVGKEIKIAVKKKLDDIDNFMKTPDFQKLLNDAWSRYKGKLPKDKWTERYKTLYRNKEKGAITEKIFDAPNGDLVYCLLVVCFNLLYIHFQGFTTILYCYMLSNNH